MTEQFPEQFSPEKPYTMQDSIDKRPKHIAKLMGALYRERKPAPIQDNSDEIRKTYVSIVLTDCENTAKKVISTSARAQ